MEQNHLPQAPPLEVRALSEITPQEAKTLVEFMRKHVPAPKMLNQNMTWEESHQVGRLFDKIRLVLTCIADKEVNHESI